MWGAESSGEGQWYRVKASNQQRACAILGISPFAMSFYLKAWVERTGTPFLMLAPWHWAWGAGLGQETFSGTQSLRNTTRAHLLNSSEASTFSYFSVSFFLLSNCLWGIPVAAHPPVGDPMFDIDPHCWCSQDCTETRLSQGSQAACSPSQGRPGAISLLDGWSKQVPALAWFAFQMHCCHWTGIWLPEPLPSVS